jgi:hypothetical protein
MRLRRYHFSEGVQWRRAFVLPCTAAIMLVIAGFGASRLNFRDLPAPQTHNNVAAVLDKEPEVSALEQSISRASELDSQDDKPLAGAIRDQLDNYPGKQEWSVYVNDLNTGLSASINADRTYSAGSLYKLFLLAPLESKIPAEQWDYNWDSGYNVSYCVDIFLSAADDSCSQQLGGYTNWDYSDEYNQKIGFINTKLGEGGEAKTNAREVGHLLSQLKTSQLLSDMGRRHVFDALYHQDYIAGIPATCDDCVVANKSTEHNGFVHDAGIVTRGQKSYVIVIMSKGGSLKQIGQISRTVDKQLSP